MASTNKQTKNKQKPQQQVSKKVINYFLTA